MPPSAGLRGHLDRIDRAGHHHRRVGGVAAPFRALSPAAASEAAAHRVGGRERDIRLGLPCRQQPRHLMGIEAHFGSVTAVRESVGGADGSRTARPRELSPSREGFPVTR